MKLRAFLVLDADVDTLSEAAAWEDRIAKAVKDLERDFGPCRWDIKERRDRVSSDERPVRYRRIDA